MRFFKIFTVVMPLALFNWLADRDRRADTNIPNATLGLSILSGHIKYESARICPAHFSSSDIKYECPNVFPYRNIDRPLSFVHTDPSFHQVTCAHTSSDCLDGGANLPRVRSPRAKD
jgi:hypothetical protein